MSAKVGCKILSLIALLTNLVVKAYRDVNQKWREWQREQISILYMLTYSNQHSRAAMAGSVVFWLENLHQRLAASTWWCGPRPSIREAGRNSESTTPRGPTIRSLPNRLEDDVIKWVKNAVRNDLIQLHPFSKILFAPLLGIQNFTQIDAPSLFAACGKVLFAENQTAAHCIDTDVGCERLTERVWLTILRVI